MKKTKGMQHCSCIEREPSEVGTHIIADFWGVKNIDDQIEIEKMLQDAAKYAKATPLTISSYKFEPQGITSFILLAESHISLHSWPEMNYVAIDAFTCGTHTKPHLAIEYLKKIFKPTSAKVIEIKRGKTATA